jgi:mono/diheme cytochrome c family protein
MAQPADGNVRAADSGVHPKERPEMFRLTNEVRSFGAKTAVGLTLIAILSTGVCSGQTKPEPGAVARGKYIVESVAKCELCHTPRDENGNPDQGRWLMGGPVQLRPSYPAPQWATTAPRIAGGPPGTEADFIKLVTTGIARTGQPPDPPMQQFHMTREDAEAVYAYLKSLGQ